MKKKFLVLVVAVAFALLFRSIAGNMNEAKLTRIRKRAAEIDLVKIEDGETMHEYTAPGDVNDLVHGYLYGREEKPSGRLTETGKVSFYMGAHLVTKGKLYEDEAHKPFVRIERILMAVPEEGR